jgi:hypothetical protein
MLNLIFAVVLSIKIELVHKNTLNIIGGNVTRIMSIAAFITNIPILMVYFSRVMPYKVNRLLNIVSTLIIFIYIIGGGSLALHYLVITGIEVLLLPTIIRAPGNGIVQ